MGTISAAFRPGEARRYPLAHLVAQRRHARIRQRARHDHAHGVIEVVVESGRD